MTEFLKKRFTVPYGGRSATDCEHGWIDPRGRCVLCGEQLEKPKDVSQLIEMVELRSQTKTLGGPRHEHDWSEWERLHAEDRNATLHRRHCRTPGCHAAERYTIPGWRKATVAP